MDKFKVNLELLVNKKLVDEKTFTVPVVLSDETPVTRITWGGDRYNLILLHSEDAVDMSRAEILPVYWNHNDNSLPIGSYTDVRLEDNKLKANAVFDGDDAFAMSIFKKVAKGHIKTLSVGADILSKTTTQEEDGSYTVRATKWQPFEGSFTGNPANPNARVGLNANSQGDAINLKNEGEDMKLEDVVQFLSNATAEDKIAIKKALGADEEVQTLSNQVQELTVKLSNSSDTVVEKANESMKIVFDTVMSETFKNVKPEAIKEAVDTVKLSNDGSFDVVKFENVLLRSALATTAPAGGGDEHKEDPYEKQNLEMAGKL
jgi:HK97 family phage prohead protease